MISETAKEEKNIQSADIYFNQLIEINPNLNDPIIKNALLLSYDAHKDQYRKSGLPYFTHAFEVAKILAEQHMDTNTICAGLLHDVIEDTEYSYSYLKNYFNKTIADLVNGVTKISNIPFKSTEEIQLETYRKMLLSTAKDIRVIIIKFADRLHNLRTLMYLNKNRIDKIARESLNLYVPLAHRLGMAKIRWEMENIAFKYLYPEDYNYILSKINASREVLENKISKLKKTINSSLFENKINAKVIGRTKHFYSIFRKMKTGKTFDEIYDLFAIRIIIKNKLDCYKVLGIIHSNWIPVQNRFKDYIATPKSNLYQSLHTTVVGPDGKMIEIQIRTEEMDIIAEEGIAAHWIYKSNKNENSYIKPNIGMQWLKQIVDMQKDITQYSEFIDFFKIDLFQSEIFVFTPKGHLIQLPKGSTVLDFAFAVHTELGYQCVAAKIQGKAVPINVMLKSGSTVEIIRAKFQHPSPNWLNWVKTAKAKRDIRHWLKQKSYEHTVSLGKEIIEKEIMKAGIKDNYSEKLSSLFPHFKLSDMNQLYYSIGNGDIPAVIVIDKMYPNKKLLEPSTKIEQKKPKLKKQMSCKSGLIINMPDNISVHLAKCCQPLPGDKITGYIIKDKGIEIHRSICTKGMMLMNDKNPKIEVNWDPKSNNLYKIKLQIIAKDRIYLLSDITKIISETKTNILHANVKPNHPFIHNTFILEIENRRHLNKVYRGLRKLKEVRKISRGELFKEEKIYETRYL